MEYEEFKGMKIINTVRPDHRAALAKKNSDWPWYYFVLAGVAFAIFAAWMHYDISVKEAQGNPIWLGRRFALLYETFGKWGITGTLSVLSVGLIGVGIWCAVTPDNKVPDDKSTSEAK